MPRYGPWVQPSTITTTHDNMAGSLATVGTGATGFRRLPDPSPPPFSTPPAYSSSVMAEVMEEAAFPGNWSTDTPLSPVVGGSSSASAFTGTRAYNTYDGCQLFLFNAHFQRRDQSLWPALTTPPGVVSVEWESDVATVVGARLNHPRATWRNHGGGTGSLTLSALQTGQPGFSVQMVEGQAPGDAPLLEYDPGSVFAPPPGWPTMLDRTVTDWTVGADGVTGDLFFPDTPLDLTGLTFGDDGWVALVAWVHIGQFPTADPSGNNFGAELGASDWGGSPDLGEEPPVTYTLQPPRYRYVFADVPGLPPTRVLPRNDGLLSASGRRVWPPPTSGQGSNRRGPGSYV